ncbi:hypothetical protein ADILRU_1004 [Leifsonia rubra CMS 76R]|nr:hypothetical protein ADILRU_1004 [Leifsonia rubra CMS 76R]
MVAASVAFYERRSALCIEHNIGLTALYNLMDDGAFTTLNREITEGARSYTPFAAAS